MIRTSTVQPYQEYQTTTSASASAAQQIAFNDANDMQRALVKAIGDTVTIKFGDSTVQASKTPTSGALPAGNFTVAAGETYEIDLNKSQNYYSVIGASGGGTAIVTLCNVNH